jgi:hypothetical protein
MPTVQKVPPPLVPDPTPHKFTREEAIALAGPRLDACRDPSRGRAGRCLARDCPATGALLDTSSSQCTSISMVSAWHARCSLFHRPSGNLRT